VLVFAAPSPCLATVAGQVAVGLGVKVVKLSPELHAAHHTGSDVLVTSWRSLLDARDPQGLQYPELQSLALAIDTLESPEVVDARAAQDSTIVPDVDRRLEWRRVVWRALKPAHTAITMPTTANLQSNALIRTNAYSDWSYSAWGWPDAALYYEVSSVIGVVVRIRLGDVNTQKALVTTLASALPNVDVNEGKHQDDWSAVVVHHALSTVTDMESPLQPPDLAKLVAELVQMMQDVTAVLGRAWNR